MYASLPAVEFDDELLVNGRVDLLAARKLCHLRRSVAVVPFEPLGWTTAARDFQVRRKDRRFEAALADGHDVAGFHDDRRNVDDPSIQTKVPVRHELTRLRATRCKVEAIDDVVETALEQL